MDKEQAASFIRTRLDQGMALDAISIELRQHLNAPPELIARFVRQVASSYPTDQAAETLSASPHQKPESINQAVPSPPAAQQGSAQPHLDSPQNIMAQPAAKTDKVASPLHPPGDTHTPEGRPPSNQTGQAALPNQDELVYMVVRTSKEHRKYSDIVETVCKETGWSWNDAQRFVARIQTENQAQIAKSHRTFMVPFSVGFIIGGFLLLLWSILASIDFYRAITNHTQSTLSVDFLPFVIVGYVTSLSLISGGFYSLYRILSDK